MKLPRIMLAAVGSGSGKTTITCGILKALLNRGIQTTSFKCGPDYIDPMFHAKVLGTGGKNLDTFFTDEQITKYLFAREAAQAEISVIEGVMGYYDGVAGITTAASSYDLAVTVDTPVVLIVNTKGMSLSVLPVIQGFLNFRKDSRICGVILNQTSEMMYRLLKPEIENTLGIQVFGFVKPMKEGLLQSRHLGLVTPDEITGLQLTIEKLAEQMERTIDLERLLKAAGNARELFWEEPEFLKAARQKAVRIGISMDEAFCFWYQDNLDILQRMGAELVEFSPLHDRELPPDLDGLIFCGGYPELYAKQLSENRTMLLSVKNAVEKLPCLAECGGFMYLHRYMEDMEKNLWQMADVFPGTVTKSDKLVRFGYVSLQEAEKQEEQMHEIQNQTGKIRGHEFHYFDSSDNGAGCIASKPGRNTQYPCIHVKDASWMGFPHLYYYSNPQFVQRFLDSCWKEKQKRSQKNLHTVTAEEKRNQENDVKADHRQHPEG